MKQTCGNDACSRRFYDLNRVPAACPYCGTPYDAPVVVRHEFATAGRQQKGKSYRLVEPPAPTAQDDVVEPEVAVEDDGPVSPADVLIDVEDEDEESTDEVIGHQAPTDETS